MEIRPMSQSRAARGFLVCSPMILWVLLESGIITLLWKHGDRFLPNRVFNGYTVCLVVSFPAIGGLIDFYRTRRLILNSTDSKTIDRALLNMYCNASMYAFTAIFFLLVLFTVQSGRF
jgi:hypothetical protein